MNNKRLTTTNVELNYFEPRYCSFIYPEKLIEINMTSQAFQTRQTTKLLEIDNK